MKITDIKNKYDYNKQCHSYITDCSNIIWSCSLKKLDINLFRYINNRIQRVILPKFITLIYRL